MLKNKVLCLILCLILALPVCAGDRLFYVSQEGYLAEFNINKITEIGRVRAGIMPKAITTCPSNIIAFTDFATDELYLYNSLTKDIRKNKINSTVYTEPDNVFYTKEAGVKLNQSLLRSSYESITNLPFSRRVHIKSKQRKKNSKILPINAKEHNKKLGLNRIVCTNRYLYVTGLLSGNLYIVNPNTLVTEETIAVGNRPVGLSKSPNNQYLALASTALDKLFIVNTQGNNKYKEIEVSSAPIALSWIDNNHVAVLSRGKNIIEFIDINTGDIQHTQYFEKNSRYINEIKFSLHDKILYAVSGLDNILYGINIQKNYEFNKINLPQGMGYAADLHIIDNNKLMISSPRTKKLLVLNLDQPYYEDTVTKILSNLTPLAFTNIKYTGLGDFDENTENSDSDIVRPQIIESQNTEQSKIIKEKTITKQVFL